MSPVEVIGLIVAILTIFFIINDSKKRGMSQGWAVIGLLGLIGLVIYLIARKPILENNITQPIIQNTENSLSKNTSQAIIIPDTCPHCKNPNTKKIRLCEWCGNQII